MKFRRLFDLLAVRLSSSLVRRIVVLNLGGLCVLVAGILVLNEFRAGLIDARLDSLHTQGRIIAGAIAESTRINPGTLSVEPERLLRLQAGERLARESGAENLTTFPINPEKIAPLLLYLVLPTGNRAQIFGPEGELILDSSHLVEPRQVEGVDLPPPGHFNLDFLHQLWTGIMRWYRAGELAPYRESESGRVNGSAALSAELRAALAGHASNTVRIDSRGELIVSVAVPITRLKMVHGVLLLSTPAGDIDAILMAERMAIFRVFLVAAAVTLVLSILLAGTIAGPVRRLASAAERVRRGIRAHEALPALDGRRDEIGHLARALRDMTNAFYHRLDANERFAADVAHEIRNPLTSLRSAVDTLPATRSAEKRAALLKIIRQDVDRAGRLISDISNASRLDAELAKAASQPVDMASLLENVAAIANGRKRNSHVVFKKTPSPGNPQAFFVRGQASRLGQIIDNLIDNAESFSPPGAVISIHLTRTGCDIIVCVDDEGPGIDEDARERLFERFYTDRPGAENFGIHSGLGLSISRQIAEAHFGEISAENRYGPRRAKDAGRAAFDAGGPGNSTRRPQCGSKGPSDGTCGEDLPAPTGQICGARFVVRLPAMVPGKLTPRP